MFNPREICLFCRKLLCGEEARLSSMSDSHITLPYIYHQSPTYTLPCFSRPGAPHRRAEPQYKFVEEIITETTREIEMSEFEESGSEETEGGSDEQGCTKRNGGGGEEEEGGHKDSGEDDGEQVPDGEQDHARGSVNGAEDESPAEINSDAKGQTDREHDREITEITKDKEDTVTHEDLFSKSEELSPEVPAEKKTTDDGDNEKTHPERDCVTKPGDKSFAEGSKGSDTTEEQSSDVQVKNKGPALVSEIEEVKTAMSDKTEDATGKML